MNTDSDEFADIRRDIPQKGFKGSQEALERVYGPTVARSKPAPVNTDAGTAAGGEVFDSLSLLSKTKEPPTPVMGVGTQWRKKHK